MDILNTFLTLHPYASFTFLAMFSLAIGSLLNLIIYRLPLMLSHEWRAECCTLLKISLPKPSTINLFYPRSFCPNCKTTIHAIHNIPVLSYLMLRGRCAACRAPISLLYPFIELLCMSLSLLAAWYFGFNATLIVALLFIWILILLCFIDLNHQILPDSLTLGLLWIGLLANSQHLFTSLQNAVFGAALAYLGLWLFIQLFYLITGKVGMGNGDFKLFAAFGAWFGWTMLPFILIFSSLLGAIIGSWYLKTHKRSTDTPIPFGPFLCCAGLIALFYGHPITEWYLRYIVL